MPHEFSIIEERTPIEDLILLPEGASFKNNLAMAVRDSLRIKPVQVANGGQAYEINYQIHVLRPSGAEVTLEIIRHTSVSRVIYKVPSHICPACERATQMPVCWYCFNRREENDRVWELATVVKNE